MFQLSFKKKLRLLSNIQFQNVYIQKKRIYTKRFVMFICLNHVHFPRLGISISKKNVSYAHDRNRIKRLIKESFRLVQNNLLLMDFIVIVKKNIHLLSNKSIFYFLQKLWIYKN
ncbi:Ribonuclease P protein component [Buchnera aphidicola (Cinara piceae)]|uniref:Ribonuclease P protein component n=1 Tax=Buchnera aphidicola (Cinara piceae) TaxID=1660043 RepID=A0A803FT72_9GAMM|nr:ribonuclease P protein component [Buchnera aphidicola]VFP87756.1 Ribonuclease P protein component [Buchnera aphidicola (Cinara piceae)]